MTAHSARRVIGWGGRRAAWLSALGFSIVLVTDGSGWRPSSRDWARRTTNVMLAGNWKTGRMVAHYSAGATAERGAVAR